ncbi:MAG: aminoacyl-tRNA hydrolase [Deltaproteobacteria bacterium]|nr:aminoacyl-tRNA hydrolase [Candidatus Anaeroferrophillus wilburensis]
MTDFLVIGLGNPGGEYAATRHNLGFQVLNRLAQELSVSFRYSPSLEAEYCRGLLGKQQVALAKPQTYMNLSGRSVVSLVTFFEIADPARVIVVHDDLDIPLGQVKIKKRGGGGGHNGVASVMEFLQTADFLRLRLGIGLSIRPPDVVDYVLSPFTVQEAEVVEEMVGKAVEALGVLVNQGASKAMNLFHRRSNEVD